MNWQQILQMLQSGAQTTGSIAGLINPPAPAAPSGLIPGVSNQQLLGAGVLGAGLLQREEPGQVVEARQYLRNLFTSPSAIADDFSGQTSALSASYQPLLTQQRQRGMDEVTQRFINAFPGQVGMQGPEVTALGRYLTDEALPREQAVLGDIAQNNLALRSNAAGTILQTNPSTLGADLSQLGTLMLLSGQTPSGGSLSGLLNPAAGAVGTPTGGASQLVQLATAAGGLNALLQSNPALATQVSALLGGEIVPDLQGLLTGVPGYAVRTSQGVLIPADAVNLGTLGAAPGGAAGGSAVASLLGGAAAAAGGGLLGYQVGKQLPTW